jgi:hypothetical protein
MMNITEIGFQLTRNRKKIQAIKNQTAQFIYADYRKRIVLRSPIISSPLSFISFQDVEKVWEERWNSCPNFEYEHVHNISP